MKSVLSLLVTYPPPSLPEKEKRKEEKRGSFMQDQYWSCMKARLGSPAAPIATVSTTSRYVVTQLR